MKKILAALLAFSTITTFARNGWEQVKGSGDLKSETRQVGNFDGLSSNGSMDVIISYGSTGSVVVEADDNLLPYIETVVEGNKLVIKTKNKMGLRTKNKITVKVQMTKVESVATSGSGDITGDGAFTSEGTTKIAISGSGNISMVFSHFGDVDARVSGSGDIILKNGRSRNLEAHVSGSGKIDAASVAFDEVEANISGSGDVKVIANKSVAAHISGSGKVFYSGTASNIKSSSSGSGKVVKV
ncbi:MAG: head GIN domain-containing protein [Chitinophagaceae bacterium]